MKTGGVHVVLRQTYRKRVAHGGIVWGGWLDGWGRSRRGCWSGGRHHVRRVIHCGRWRGSRDSCWRAGRHQLHGVIHGWRWNWGSGWRRHSRTTSSQNKSSRNGGKNKLIHVDLLRMKKLNSNPRAFWRKQVCCKNVKLGEWKKSSQSQARGAARRFWGVWPKAVLAGENPSNQNIRDKQGRRDGQKLGQVAQHLVELIYERIARMSRVLSRQSMVWQIAAYRVWHGLQKGQLASCAGHCLHLVMKLTKANAKKWRDENHRRQKCQCKTPCLRHGGGEYHTRQNRLF